MSFAWGAQRRNQLQKEKEALENAKLLYKRACQQLDERQYAVAQSLLDEALGLHPSSAACFLARGKARLGLSKIPQAIADFEMAAVIDPDKLSAQGYWGLGYAFQKRYNDAIDHLNLALRDAESPEQAQLPSDLFLFFTYWRGIAAQELGDWEAADKDFSTVLKFMPRSASALLKRGNVRLHCGLLPAAAIDLGNAAEVQPDHPDPHAQLASVLERLERYEEAALHYHQAIELTTDPNMQIRRSQQGDSMLALTGLIGDDNVSATADDVGSKGQRLARQGQQAMVSVTRLSHLLAQYGRCLAILGRHAEALSAFDKAVGLDPYDTATLLARSAAWSVMGNNDSALSDAQRAAQLDSDSVAAQLRMGDVLTDLRDYQAAFDSLTTALGLIRMHRIRLLMGGNAPTESQEYMPAVVLSYARVALVLHKHYQAVEVLTAVIDGDFYPSLSSQEKQNIMQARSSDRPLERVVSEDHRLYSLRGQINYAIYLFDNAREDLTRALELEESYEKAGRTIFAQTNSRQTIVRREALLWRARVFLKTMELNSARNDIFTLLGFEHWQKRVEPYELASQIAFEGRRFGEAILCATEGIKKAAEQRQAIAEERQMLQKRAEQRSLPRPESPRGEDKTQNDSPLEVMRLMELADQVEQLDQCEAQCYVQRARANAALRRFGSAARDLKLATALQVTPYTLTMLAAVLLRCRRPTSALHAARKVIGMASSSESLQRMAHYVAAVALEYRGQDSEAEKHLNAVIQGTGGVMTEAVHERAKVRQQLGHHAEAVEDFQSVLRVQPTNARALYRLAFSLQASNCPSAAWQAMRDASKLEQSPFFTADEDLLRSGLTWLELVPPGNEDTYQGTQPQAKADDGP